MPETKIPDASKRIGAHICSNCIGSLILYVAYASYSAYISGDGFVMPNLNEVSSDPKLGYALALTNSLIWFPLFSSSRAHFGHLVFGLEICYANSIYPT